MQKQGQFTTYRQIDILRGYISKLWQVGEGHVLLQTFISWAEMLWSTRQKLC